MSNYKKGTPTSSSRTTVRIPLVTSKHITEIDSVFTGSTKDSTLITNGIIDQYQGDKERSYIRARPSLNMEEIGPQGIGRGIYYWEGPQKYVLVVGTKIYLNNYSTQVTGTMDSANSGVSFIEWNFGLNNYLFIFDSY